MISDLPSREIPYRSDGKDTARAQRVHGVRYISSAGGYANTHSLVRVQSILLAQKRNVDGIITGHTHFCENSRESDIRYVNTGCWTEHPCSYVTVNSGEITLHHLAD